MPTMSAAAIAGDEEHVAVDEAGEVWPVWLPLKPEEQEYYGTGAEAFYFTATDQVWDVQYSDG